MAAGTGVTAPAANVWNASNYFAVPGQVNAVATMDNWFRIGGVVVLPGTQAPTAVQSPLVMRPYGAELLTCQRYYARATYSIRFQTPALYGSTSFAFPVEMRAVPTLSVVVAGTRGNIASTSMTPSSPYNSARVDVVAAAANTDTYILSEVAAMDARL